MIQFDQSDLNFISKQVSEALASNSFGSHGLIKDEIKVNIPLEKYPDFTLVVVQTSQPSYDAGHFAALVEFQTNENKYLLGFACDFNDKQDFEFHKETIFKCLDSFASFYNSLEKGDDPKPWRQLDGKRSLNEQLLFAQSRTFFGAYIKENPQLGIAKIYTKTLNPKMSENRIRSESVGDTTPVPKRSLYDQISVATVKANLAASSHVNSGPSLPKERQ